MQISFNFFYWTSQIAAGYAHKPKAALSPALNHAGLCSEGVTIT